MWFWMLLLVVSLAQVAWWALDRDPPFRLIIAQANSPQPGGVLLVRSRVQRDLERDCSVVFSRYLFDRNGTRHDATSPQMMTAQGLRNMDALAPGQLNVQIQVPDSFPPGHAVMTTILEYRCNPLQDIARPIPVEMSVPFEVVP